MPSATAVPDPTLSDSDTNDSDFAASISDLDTEGSSSSNDEDTPRRKRKRAGDDEVLGSGDEGIVESGRKKKRRKHRKRAKQKDGVLDGKEEDEESEDGVGARLRRRREGRGERGPKKNSKTGSETATIDVDALWARLNNAPSTRPKPDPPPSSSQDGAIVSSQGTHPPETSTPASGITFPPSEMVTIKRTYNFAGTTTTEDKLVPRDSAEARLYFSSLESTKTPEPSPVTSRPALRRPLRRPSRFDTPASQPTDLLKATAAIKAPLKSVAELKAESGQKLNTVEKSRLDWAGYVDKEKLKDELDKAGKAKGGYLDKMDFLGRSEMARDENFREGKKR